MNCQPPDGHVVAVHVGGVVRLQDVALQANHGDLGIHGLPHHGRECSPLVGRHDQQVRLLPDESFHLRHLLAVVLLCVADDQLDVRILGQQFRQKGILRGAIRLRIVRLAERHHELFLPLPAAAAGQHQTSRYSQ